MSGATTRVQSASRRSTSRTADIDVASGAGSRHEAIGLVVQLGGPVKLSTGAAGFQAPVCDECIHTHPPLPKSGGDLESVWRILVLFWPFCVLWLVWSESP